jgi:hypothetical protein
VRAPRNAEQLAQAAADSVKGLIETDDRGRSPLDVYADQFLTWMDAEPEPEPEQWEVDCRERDLRIAGAAVDIVPEGEFWRAIDYNDAGPTDGYRAGFGIEHDRPHIERPNARRALEDASGFNATYLMLEASRAEKDAAIWKVRQLDPPPTIEAIASELDESVTTVNRAIARMASVCNT